MVIQCPPLCSFSHQADPTTDSLFDGSFARSVGTTVDGAASLPPSLPHSLFPCAAAPSVPLTSPTNVNRKARANTDSGTDGLAYDGKRSYEGAVKQPS